MVGPRAKLIRNGTYALPGETSAAHSEVAWRSWPTLVPEESISRILSKAAFMPS